MTKLGHMLSRGLDYIN